MEIESGANNGGNDYQMIVRFFELTFNTVLVVGLTVVLKQLLQVLHLQVEE